MMFSKDKLLSQTLNKPLVIVLLGFEKAYISFNGWFDYSHRRQLEHNVHF